MTEEEIEKKWENTVWDTDIYLDDIDKLDEKKHKCGSAKSCEYGDMCKPKYDIGGCSHYREKRPQTNEEWLKSCNTEQLAKWIAKCIKDTIILTNGNRKYTENITSEKWWAEWLKQPHTPKE